MFNFIKKLLSKERSLRQGGSSKFDSMGYSEILVEVQQMPDAIEINQASALTKRLYEISLYDHHVSAEERVAAADLLAVLKTSVESALKDNAGALDAYRNANLFMEENARLRGVGSLSWLIKENNVEPKAVLSFVTLPEHLPLLEDFYASIPPSERETIRHHIQQYLRRQ